MTRIPFLATLVMCSTTACSTQTIGHINLITNRSSVGLKRHIQVLNSKKLVEGEFCRALSFGHHREPSLEAVLNVATGKQKDVNALTDASLERGASTGDICYRASGIPTRVK